ncbi:KGGVGR-motif variant AAA ATPase [Lentzea jiangxiensis]|uniref:CobQ/CobB/MinD/ParA nucleotide binding domain-containing protein n=1 Tax=Lentzea jiangxiensis TaxID=641025 RepID=A0A1H0WHN4_9PSEU|nr:AAA family ATPase [Lentzea jiangxiensis]SDP90083.1 CobQ/CobB/MinD/ParA nucleotide binding domain-containing protein [Lentzea jiangxiensis]
MSGTVITFYSYKGGVGRSFTLANTAVLLARWGYRVLAVDWDLEAPGLHLYFRPHLSHVPDSGVVDLAYDFLQKVEVPPAHTVRVDVEGGVLDLMAAGKVVGNKLDAAYTYRMQEIDWEELYEQGFAEYLEDRREEWIAKYDFVLIDSRTGVSDIAGICAAQLPDRLVVVFTANEQNLNEVVDIVHLADQARDRLPYDRPRHQVMPVLSRLDNRMEYERAEEWQQKCVGVVAPLFNNWLVKGVTPEQMVRHLTVPYISYWSFGELLPVLAERPPSSDQISFALETVAAVIAQEFDRTDLLADNRDAYVAAARSRHRRKFDWDLLVSSPRTLWRTGTELITELRLLGVTADRSVSGDPEFLDQTDDPAEHLCLVVDGALSRWQLTEAERFMRRTLGPDGSQRQMFCLLTRGTDRELLPGFLRSLRHLQFDPTGRPAQVARELHDLIKAAPAPETEPDLEALRIAEAALRELPDQLSYEARLALLGEAVGGMTSALDDGDMDLLRDRSADLMLLSKSRSNGTGVPVPGRLRAEVGALLTRIDRRINAFTD